MTGILAHQYGLIWNMSLFCGSKFSIIALMGSNPLPHFQVFFFPAFSWLSSSTELNDNCHSMMFYCFGKFVTGPTGLCPMFKAWDTSLLLLAKQMLQSWILFFYFSFIFIFWVLFMFGWPHKTHLNTTSLSTCSTFFRFIIVKKDIFFIFHKSALLCDSL